MGNFPRARTWPSDQLVKEFLKLLPLYLQSKGRNLAEFSRVVLYYYRNAAFRTADLCLRWHSLLDSPYAVNKRFLQLRGEKEIYTYGETPLTTLETICKSAQLQKDDRVIDLGCGPGHTSFWMRCHIGCEVIGIDWIPDFIDRAKAAIRLEKIQFACLDMRFAPFEEATFVYLCGTCLEDEVIVNLGMALRRLPKGAKVATVSYPLSDYIDGFEMEREFDAPFSWGVATVYVQKRA